MTKPYRIALHGGAGVNPGRNYSVVEEHLGTLIASCASWLERGMAAIDVVEAAVVDMESSGFYVAGRGSAPNSSGTVECDASIMDGTRNLSGGVCALSGIANPVSAARAVLEKTPYALLAGEGARAFALEQGCEIVSDSADYFRIPIGVDREETLRIDQGLAHGTVGAVALDQSGRLASATSTGGLFGKLAGRVGDTPIIGAGTWADQDLAISCTGIGEAFMRAGGARDIAARMRYGGTTLSNAANDLLKSVAEEGGDGGLIALDREGNVVMPFNSGGMKRAFAGSGLPTKVRVF